MPRLLLLTLFPLLLPLAAGASTIRFEALDLADTVPGQDRWQYTYAVSGFAFPQNHGFSIFFDPAVYTALESPPAVNADWDIIVLQPDVLLPDEGLYDALALANDAGLTDPFVVTFTWLGTGSPGAQPFELYDASFQAIEQGITVPVPEPTTGILLLLGLTALCRTRTPHRTPRGETSAALLLVLAPALAPYPSNAGITFDLFPNPNQAGQGCVEVGIPGEIRRAFFDPPLRTHNLERSVPITSNDLSNEAYASLRTIVGPETLTLAGFHRGATNVFSSLSSSAVLATPAAGCGFLITVDAPTNVLVHGQVSASMTAARQVTTRVALTHGITADYERTGNQAFSDIIQLVPESNGTPRTYRVEASSAVVGVGATRQGEHSGSFMVTVSTNLTPPDVVFDHGALTGALSVLVSPSATAPGQVSIDIAVQNDSEDQQGAPVATLVDGQIAVRLACLDEDCATPPDGDALARFVDCEAFVGVERCEADPENPDTVLITLVPEGKLLPPGATAQLANISAQRFSSDPFFVYASGGEIAPIDPLVSQDGEPLLPDSTPAPQFTVALFYSNGVRNDETDALHSRNVLKETLSASLAPSEFNQITFQLSHAGCDGPGCFADFVEAVIIQIPVLGTQQVLRILAGIEEIPVELRDTIRAVIESFDLLGAATNTDFTNHIDRYAAELGAGQRVIVVAHSQGNLFSNQSASALSQIFSADELQQFGIVSIATPAAETFGDCPYTTLVEDRVILAARVLGALPANTNNFMTGAQIDASTGGHNFVNAYLEGGVRASRTRIVDHVRSMVNAPDGERCP